MHHISCPTISGAIPDRRHICYGADPVMEPTKNAPKKYVDLAAAAKSDRHAARISSTTHACRGVCSRHRSMHRFPVQEADMWATCQKIARSGRYRMCPLNYPSHIATLPRLLERLARICHVRHSLCRRRHLCRHREWRGDQCGRCRRLHRWCRRRRRRRCCGRRRRWRRGSWRRCGRGRARHAAGHDTARLGVEEGGVVLHQPATARGCTSQQEVSVCDTR